MSNFYESIGKFFGVLFLTIVLMLWMVFSSGYVLLHYYEWFIIPLGYNLPTLSLLQFVGISFFMKLFISKSNKVWIKDEYKDKTTENVAIVLSPFIALLFGYILKSFI
jgi:hypothetical protein